MNVAIIGTGYVGLVTGTCLAEVGHDVVCMDRDAEKIATLEQGGVPIYEEGLDDLIQRNVAAGRLRFTTELVDALAGTEAIFLAIGTPQGEDGSADLSMMLAAAEQIGSVMTTPLVIVQKSTCPVGTVVKVETVVAAALAARGASIPFTVVSNPEFLREGSAVRDFMQPDRVVIGADDEVSGRLIASLYERIAPPDRIILMDRASAELTKYAANAFLATKISFINDIANLCEIVGADVEQVRRGIGSDSRIGPAFLAAGIGYGGSCFPKDVKALLRTSHDHRHSLRVVEAVEAVNHDQRSRQLEKILAHFGGQLVGRRIALWGVAFKPGTDDMREAPAIYLTQKLVELGAEVVAFDPVAMENARGVIDAQVRFAADALTCVDGADALVLVTEWPEFLAADLNVVGAAMRNRVLFDLRNGFSPAGVASTGFTYFGVGRAANTNRDFAVL